MGRCLFLTKYYTCKLTSFFSWEITLQLNSTYVKAISAISYKVVFNRRPKYYRVPVGAREIAIDQVKIEEVNNKVDDTIVYKAAEQLAIEVQAKRR